MAEEKPRVIRHIPVYDVDGRFGGWPANHGMWIWGNEILFGFSAGYYKDRGLGLHGIDHDKPEEHLLARSLDGGESWNLEYPGRRGMLIGDANMRHGIVPPDQVEKEPIDCPGGIDFTHPDLAMTARMSGIHTGVSRLYYSYDRGKNWKGPFKLPLFGQKGIAARTDYIVNGKHDCLFFLTASKSNNREGRPICVRTTDGGKSWDFVSYIGPEPGGFGIMPSTVRLSETDLLTTIRARERRGEKNHRWIDAWLSKDNGENWQLQEPPVKDLGVGNPPALLELQDGRLCLTYAYRGETSLILAKLSDDRGRTWSEQIVLRDDGASTDVGYTRTVQRPDGKLVTAYYFHDPTDIDRKIVVTIWDAGSR